jgi:hypothetical protein
MYIHVYLNIHMQAYKKHSGLLAVFFSYDVEVIVLWLTLIRLAGSHI